MRKLLVFNNVSVDGFIADARGDMSWAHKSDPEWMAYVRGNASGESHFLFGRKTYELMAAYWPTPAALQANPPVAQRMNETPKVVFSRTLANAAWQNTTVVREDVAGAVRNLKNEPGPGMVIFGSGTIVALLASEGLIDEFQMVINPVALGSGRPMFAGLTRALTLETVGTRPFKNGNVVITYRALPAARPQATTRT